MRRSLNLDEFRKFFESIWWSLPEEFPIVMPLFRDEKFFYIFMPLLAFKASEKWAELLVYK